MSDQIQFLYRGVIHSVSGISPTKTVLQYVREDLSCSGTKEGCAEGDCGACTVVLGEMDGETLKFRSVNSCIQFLPTLDGKSLFTVEDLKQVDGKPHPVQQAMIDCHGSQCGFCTPGFVMSLWNLYLKTEGNTDEPTRAEINENLSGNLCRCTGYRPIIEAARQMGKLPEATLDRKDIAVALKKIERISTFAYQHEQSRFFAPRTLNELVELKGQYSKAYMLAGSTDVGLWVTKKMMDLQNIIYIGQIKELKNIEILRDSLEIGAAVTLTDAYAAICDYYRNELDELRQRFASLPIRNAGTLGGNVANGSPIGDSMPWLIALGATIVLFGPEGRREMPIEDFYLGYQKKDLREDEFVEKVRIPLPVSGRQFRAYKVAKRFDQDISAVCGAFSVYLDDGAIAEARIAYGGMAATPKRARRAEAALIGNSWTEDILLNAMTALKEDFAPLSDMRASANYRATIAQNLLRRFWLETNPEAPLPRESVNAYIAVTSGEQHE